MARGPRRASAWVDGPHIETARPELLQGLPKPSESAGRTDFSLTWLAENLNVAQSLVLAKREGEAVLSVVGSYGLPTASLEKFTVSVEDWRQPLVQILANRRHVFFPPMSGASGERRRRPA